MTRTFRPISWTRPCGPPGDDRGLRRARRSGHRGLSERQGNLQRDHQTPSAQGGCHRRLLPGSVRFGLQEQGRAAAARRGRRLSAVAARSSVHQGYRRETETKSLRRSGDDQPLSMLAFKLMDDPVRHPDLLRGSIRASSTRATAPQFDPRARPSASAAWFSCTPIPARRSPKLIPATSSLSSDSRTPAPATRCAILASRSFSRRWNFPIRSSKWRSSRRPRPTRRRWAWRCTSLPPRIRPSACRPTRSRARPSSRAWASFISTSRSTS